MEAEFRRALGGDLDRLLPYGATCAAGDPGIAGIVIRHNLASCAGESQVRRACFPVVKTIESFDRLDLLIVDQMGYGRFSELGTQLLFEVLRAGYEWTSLVITTTIWPDKWGEAFGNEYIPDISGGTLVRNRDTFNFPIDPAESILDPAMEFAFP